MKIEEMTDAQIEDYLYKYKIKEHDQQLKCNEENEKLKYIQNKTQILKSEKFVRSSGRQKQMKIGG